MARKDATGAHTPTEQYRKQIGKQDWKKSKKDVKAQKRAADQQTQVRFGAVLLFLLAFAVTMAGLYVFLVWLLDKSSQVPTSGHKHG